MSGAWPALAHVPNLSDEALRALIGIGLHHGARRCARFCGALPCQPQSPRFTPASPVRASPPPQWLSLRPSAQCLSAVMVASLLSVAPAVDLPVAARLEAFSLSAAAGAARLAVAETSSLSSELRIHRAAQRDSSSDATARKKVRPAPRHGRPTSCSVSEARAKYISKRATCAKEAREPRTSSYCSECASVARLLLKRVVDDLADRHSDTTSEAASGEARHDRDADAQYSPAARKYAHATRTSDAP